MKEKVVTYQAPNVQAESFAALRESVAVLEKIDSGTMGDELTNALIGARNVLAFGARSSAKNPRLTSLDSIA